jgi:hypothetical protein
MILRIATIFCVMTLFLGSSHFVSNAQQTQTPTRAVQLMGLVGLAENTKGTLTVVNGSLRFIHAKGNVDVAAESIQDVVTGKDSQRVIGGTMGTVASLAAPYGSGRVLSLFRKKLDTLTIKYRDVDGGLHGAIFTMHTGSAETIKKELIAQGAHTSIPTPPDTTKTPLKPSAPQEPKP